VKQISLGRSFIFLFYYGGDRFFGGFFVLRDSPLLFCKNQLPGTGSVFANVQNLGWTKNITKNNVLLAFYQLFKFRHVLQQCSPL
jgi:hypothetical protein